MSDLFQRYRLFIDKKRAAGLPLTTYGCPDCDEEIVTGRPNGGEGPFDTAVVCPFCEQLHFIVVYDDGEVARGSANAAMLMRTGAKA